MRYNPHYAVEEYESLNKLHIVFNEDKQFLSTIPKPLFSKKLKNNIIAVETAINGESFSDRITKANYFRDKKNIDTDLNIITGWLLKFNKLGREVGKTEFREIGEEFYNVPESITVKIKKNYQYTEHCFSLLQHGDFFAKNIFLQGNNIGVIDWEHIAYGYPPLFDYFCFVTSLNFIHDIDDTGGYGSSAYYLDERSENCLVEGNLSVDVARPSHNHMALKNTIRNNVFIFHGDARITFPKSSDYILEKNVIYATGKITFANSEAIATLRSNLIFSGKGEIIGRQTGDQSDSDSEFSVLDKTNIIADPLLIEFENGVVTFDDQSPVHKLGIQSIDVSDAGPR